MGPFAGVAISCMYLVLASSFLEMISVAELQLLTMGLSDMGFLCVFFRKYTCGVLVSVLERVHSNSAYDVYFYISSLVCFSFKRNGPWNASRIL